jgi:WD40 repeat protein
VWRIKSADEEGMLSRILPVERSSKEAENQAPAPEPWLLHSLPVNALNFCAFTLCFIPFLSNGKFDDGNNDESTEPLHDAEDGAYFAVPNALNSGAIDIFHLPSERRVSTIPADTSAQTGMVMAVKILIKNNNPQDPLVFMLSGYEDGHVMVHVSRPPSELSKAWKWTKLYVSRPHSQPVLSLDSVQAEANQMPSFFYTSSADAHIVKHPIPSISAQMPSHVDNTPLKVLNTKHSGQQGLSIRGDKKIFATAGWDARIRVYSCKTMKELAILKWHGEGCYAVAFADILSSTSTESPSTQEDGDNTAVQTQPSPLGIVRQQRDQKAQQTHWLAAGSKDGKISLWDIY